MPDTDTNRTVSIILLFIINAFPLIGFLVFGWSSRAVVLLYCFDAVALFVAYGCCALAAQQKRRWDYGDGLPEEPWDPGQRTIPLPGSLPAGYLWNLRALVPALFLLVVFTPIIGSFLIRDTTTEGVRFEAIDPMVFLGGIEELLTPAGLLVMAAILLAHLTIVQLLYFRPDKYEDESAMVIGYFLHRFYILYAVLLFPAVIVSTSTVVVLYLLAAELAAEPSVDPLVVIGCLLVGYKLWIDWTRVRGEVSPDGGRLTRFFAKHRQ
ncbi:DUF6498-containing protein [Natronorubrum sp. DTA28]|uniref:DUF6498-containing protein n=1 Tax=Natronorubrum sp. DTA28 TaxID=3447019 RepID=UPI003F82E12E